jgi:hypothetical protein
VIGYSDLDFVGCVDIRKSTFGYLFFLAKGEVSWKSGKQSIISTSTMEAGFVACFEATIQANWLQNFCCDVAVAQINYPSFKHNTQDSIVQARGRSHEEGLVQIFMLYVM